MIVGSDQEMTVPTEEAETKEKEQEEATGAGGKDAAADTKEGRKGDKAAGPDGKREDTGNE